MASPVIVPETARIHYDDTAAEWRIATRVLSEKPADNEFLEVVKKVLSLAEVIAALLEAFTPILDGDTRTAAPVGNMHALASDITASYPSGNIPAKARVAENLPTDVGP